MAQESFPFDGTGTGDAGAYDAAHDRQFFKRFFGVSADEYLRGVMWGVDDHLVVEASSPAGKSVSVGAGAAIVNGVLFYNDAAATLTIEDNTSGAADQRKRKLLTTTIKIRNMG